MSQLPPSPGTSAFGSGSQFGKPSFVFSPPKPDPRESIDFLMTRLQDLRKRQKELKDELTDVEGDIHNTLMDLKPLVKIVNDTIDDLTKQ